MASVETKKRKSKKTVEPTPLPEPEPVIVAEPEPESVAVSKSKSKKSSETGKPKAAPKPKAPAKAKTTAKTTSAETLSPSVIQGESQPALFIEELDAQLPPSPVKKGRKPPIVASITPEGIHGSLQNNDHRPLIAHLPIHCSDIDSELFCDTTKQPDDKNGLPNPYDPEDVFSMFDHDKQQPIIDVPVEEDKESKKQFKQVGRPSLPIHYSEKLMIRYQDSNREQRLPETIDIACFWDCQPFRTQPCILPIAIEEGIWRVYGNFCSPECAAAFLFHERLDSHVQWERYALLNRLYSSEDSNDVRLAPPRSALRLFGGIMDVSEFRNTISEKRMRIDVMTPPMISIIQVMDTKPIDFYDASMKNTFIPWEMDRMNRPGAQGLRLQRSKPIAEKESTLEFCMGIMANT